MTKGSMIYEGKAKKVFATDDASLCIVDYKDDATAFNGEKKGSIAGKGVVNNRMSNMMFKLLASRGVENHFVEELSERETVVKKVTIVPLEVIIRNVAAGSFSKRFGVQEGTVLNNPTLEYSLKDDSLGDPLINDSHITAIGAASKEELELISSMAYKVNDILKEFFKTIGIELIDFKIEFGKDSGGKIILADEISPDTCRLWDIETHQKLDKDRFRRDMGGVEEAYAEVFKRLNLN